MKKTSFILVLFFLISFPLASKAFSTKASGSIFIDKDETIDGNLYAAGESITINGKVSGDVFCAGRTVNINGEVDGDVICAAQDLNISGKIGGSVRSIGNNIKNDGLVSRNFMALASSIMIGQKAEIGWDMFAASKNNEIYGKVGKDLYGAADNMIIAGRIGKNVRLRLDDKQDGNGLKITKEAIIAGDLVYASKFEADASNGKISGSIKRYDQNIPANKPGKGANIAGGLSSIFSALIIGLVLVSFAKKPISAMNEGFLQEKWPTVGWGALAVFITPFICLLLLFTWIGIPLAFMIFLLWIITLMASKVLAGILLGKLLIEKYWANKKESLMTMMTTGVIALSLICFLPIVGFLASITAQVAGAGMMLTYAKNLYSK